MLQELDYLLDSNDDIWIVTHFREDGPYGYVIYKRMEGGDRHNYLTGYDYVKQPEQNMSLLPYPQRIFHPKDCFTEHYRDLNGLWKTFADQMIISGINSDRIGIFGSYLVGFDVKKDIDFVLYGDTSLKIYHEHNDRIKTGCGCRYISKEHVDYQVEKYGSLYHKQCDLRKIIERNWSGIQNGNGIGILSTPRFIPDSRIIIPNQTSIDETIECTVITGLTSSCVPRYCDVLYKGERYRLITTFWMFQSFAKEGDHLRVRCNVNEKDKILLLSSKEHWLQYMD